jgi:hypothetical protein
MFLNSKGYYLSRLGALVGLDHVFQAAALAAGANEPAH